LVDADMDIREGDDSSCHPSHDRMPRAQTRLHHTELSSSLAILLSLETPGMRPDN